MWKLTVRSPASQPKVYHLKPGKNLIGRISECDILIEDVSASRRHAELLLDPTTDHLTLHDLDSRNGTYINHRRISEPVNISIRDTIRIGNCVINLEQPQPDSTSNRADRIYSGTRPLTREVLLEALDQQAVMIYEIARQLNTILDLPTALREVSNILQRAMGADHCGIILTENFDKLQELGYPETIAREAIERRSTIVLSDIPSLTEHQVGRSARLAKIRSILCVPVLSGEEILGLIYLFKTNPNAPPFDPRDLQLAVSISHQAAQTIQRTRLVQELQDYRLIQSLIGRFVSADEAESLLEEYLRTGALPGMRQQKLTILVVDIAQSSCLLEQMGAAAFGGLLERFYQEISIVIFNRHGLVRFMGDGVMAIFDEALVAQKPQERAVRAGCEIIEHMKTLDFGSGNQPVVVGVGIATGSVAAGYVGGQERTEYVVLGEAFKVASLLQQLARPYRLLIDAETCLSIQEQFSLQELGETSFAGIHAPQYIYEVLGLLG